jgi:hypothetical protein
MKMREIIQLQRARNIGAHPLPFALRTVGILLLLTSGAWGQSPNPDPRGLYVYTWEVAVENSPTAASALSKGGTLEVMNALKVPGIDGISLLVTWNELEPEPGIHQWDSANGQGWSSTRIYVTGDQVLYPTPPAAGSKLYISQIDGNLNNSPGAPCAGVYAPNCAWHETGAASPNLLDEWIIAAAQAGKKIILAVRAGQNTPCWLFGSSTALCGSGYSAYANPPATMYSFQAAAHQGQGIAGCVPVNMAAPWDHVFLGAWDELLGSLSDHLKQTPVPNSNQSLYDFVNIVRVSGINRTTDETRIPAEILSTAHGEPCDTNAVDTWLGAGYRPSLMLSAWGQLMESIQNHFGDKYFNVAVIATNGGPQSASRNGQFPFPVIDDQGQVYCNSIPQFALNLHWTNPLSCNNGVPGDQNLPLITLASQQFPGQLVVEVENLAFGFKNGEPQAFPAHPDVVSYAQTLGTIPGFATNNYLGPVPARNGGASCYAFSTVAAGEKQGTITPAGGGRCFAENSFLGTPTPPSWYGELLSSGITPATVANSAWNTTADPFLKSQFVEVFFPDINGPECAQNPLLPPPTTLKEFKALALQGPGAGCGYPVEIAQGHADLISPPLVTISFPAASATHWYTQLPLNGRVTATSAIGKPINQLDCAGAASGPGSGGDTLSVDTQGSPALVKCTATDAAGNMGESTRALWIDDVPPVTTASFARVPGQTTVTLTATDNLSGVAETQFSVDGAGFVTGTTIVLSRVGTHTVRYHSIDVAGNVEKTHSLLVTVLPKVPPPPPSCGKPPCRQ